MPIYEYYCRTCAQRFELLRAASRREEAGTCPQGHAGATPVISVFASVARGDRAGEMPSGGGCACGGGGCGCGH